MSEQMVKVLSLYQPWATLVVIGAKKFETRSWATSYRGPLFIHASKRFTSYEQHLCSAAYFSKALQDHCDEQGKPILPRGAIIGRVDLSDCVATQTWLDERLRTYGRVQHCVLTDFSKGGDLFLTSEDYREYAFGNYEAGRFAWKLENPVKFDVPIPAKGSLGIWEFPESALGHLAESESKPAAIQAAKRHA